MPRRGMEAAVGTEEGRSQPESGGEPRSRLRRLLEVTAFWGIWVAIGQIFDLGDSLAKQDTYLLIGIPLVLLFQVGVARRDVRELWVRNSPAVLLPRLTIALAAALAIYPIAEAIKVLADAGPLSFLLAALASAAGAGAAAYAFGLFRSETFRYLLLCILFATGYNVLIQVITDIDLLSDPTAFHPSHDVIIVVTSFLMYIPRVFVMEEVVFRGAFDSHLQRPGEDRGLLTAIYVSLLWALWHAPLFGWDAAVSLIIAMVPMGVFLSIYWRKSGNLGVPGTAHALSDSIRNAISGVP